MDEGLLACYPTCESDMPAYTCSGNGHGQAAIMSVIDVGRLGPFGTSGNHSPPAGASVSSPSTSGSASMHSAGETLPVVFSELPGAAAASGSSARASASAAAPAAGGSSGTSEQPLPRASKAAGARARAAAAAQQRGRAAATAAIAHGEYTAAGKRRGRPPRENMAYSREYLAVKRYRERQRSMMGDLEQEVALKLAQLQVLVTQNEVLQAREKVLMAYTAATAPQAAQQPLLQRERERAAVAHALAAGAINIKQKSGLGMEGPSCYHGAAKLPADFITDPPSVATATAAAAAEAAAAPSPQASKARVHGFINRYCAYLRHVQQHRLQRGGLVVPLAPGDHRQGEMRGLVDTVMTMPNEDTYELLAVNLETGRREALPGDTWTRVARKLLLTPQQQARILAAWKGFEAELQLLNTQRRRLCAQLAGLGRYLAWLPANVQFKNAVKSSLTREAGLSSLLLSDDHDDILMALQANMRREDRQWHLLSWSLTYMVEEHNMAQLCALAYPYMPSIGQVFAAYVAEVLGHKSEVLGFAPSG